LKQGGGFRIAHKAKKMTVSTSRASQMRKMGQKSLGPIWGVLPSTSAFEGKKWGHQNGPLTWQLCRPMRFGCLLPIVDHNEGWQRFRSYRSLTTTIAFARRILERSIPRRTICSSSKRDAVRNSSFAPPQRDGSQKPAIEDRPLLDVNRGQIRIAIRRMSHVVQMLVQVLSEPPSPVCSPLSRTTDGRPRSILQPASSRCRRERPGGAWPAAPSRCSGFERTRARLEHRASVTGP